jgi:hypothetical protein
MLTDEMKWAVIGFAGFLLVCFAIAILFRGGKARGKKGDAEFEIETPANLKTTAPNATAQPGTATLEVGRMTNSEAENTGTNASAKINEMDGSTVINKSK